MIIEKDCFRTENANITKKIGKINLNSYQPYSKNPKIAKVFREIGFADELGAGVKNMYKYTKIYSWGEPELKEDDIFRAYIPITMKETTQETTQENFIGLNSSQKEILKLMKINSSITRKEIANRLQITEDGIKYNINVLKRLGIIKREGSTKKGTWVINQENDIYI